MDCSDLKMLIELTTGKSDCERSIVTNFKGRLTMPEDHTPRTATRFKC